MYVPSTTLSSWPLRISHTEVVQHQGEMVIIFPWAYHQAYTSGPIITEEILYAGDRCKVFHEENLYRHCSLDCAAGQADDFDIGLVFFDTISGVRSDGRYRPDQEPSPIVPSASQLSQANQVHASGSPEDPAYNEEDMPIGGVVPRDLVTGRLLKPHEWGNHMGQSDDDDDNESDEAPHRRRRRRN